MRHFTSPSFWKLYNRLPASVRDLADKQYLLLKSNPRHSSLRLKKVGKFWSVRVGIHYRAAAVQIDEGLLWFWIGRHAEYDELVK